MGRNHIHIAAGRPGASGVLSGEYLLSMLRHSPEMTDRTVSECPHLKLPCRDASELRDSYPY